jgi:cellulose synthase/poly-beta-1,6-N-acetylglucosamine synthase-like glycosyltransferase
MACFSEPGIGAVGGIVKVANARSSILARAQGVFYANSYYLFKTVENAFRKVQCLSGPIVSMRKDVFLKMSDEVSSRNFLGLSITNGEDRALTQMLLRNGYGTYVNFDAKCWTNVPETFDQYLKQQLRWRKSAIGQWVEAITKYRKYSPISMFLSILPVSVTLLWMLLIITSLLTYNFMPILLSVVVFHVIISPILASIYWYVNRKDPYEAIDTPMPFVLAMVIASFWFPISGLLVGMFAVCSLDDGSWITRSNT